MRRSVWICLGTVLCVLAAALVFQRMDDQTGLIRYHQHREQPSEAALGVCPDCGGEGALCTHLPIVRIETGGQTIPGKAVAVGADGLTIYGQGENGASEIQVRLSTVAQEGQWHHPDDEPDLVGTAMFRIRGNSSRWFSKSSYRIALVEENAPEQNARLPLLGMGQGREWALHGPFLDKTLLRNYMWLNLSAEVMGYAPNARYCELMLDGAYQGVYLLMESIATAVQDRRLPLTEYEVGDPATSYMVRIEPYANLAKAVNNFSFYTNRLEPNTRMELIYPGLTYQSDAVREYVQADLNEIEKSLFSLENKNGGGRYAEELDLNSFADYYIIQEFLGVNDAFSASTYFYRDVRGRLCAGPVWDFNNVLDNFLRVMPEREFILSQRGWFGQLMQDADFVELVIRRYRELRRGVLAEERLLSYVEETQAWLGSAIERNYEVWGYTFDSTQVTSHERRRPDAASGQTLQDVNPSSYQEAITWMNNYMVERGRFLDRSIDSLRQYCHPSRNALWTLG